jgi:hypothetical protein
MPMGFPREALESCGDYAPSDSDIFVVSYPKSGTTWLQYIVYLLVRRQSLGPDDYLTDKFPHLEEMGAAYVEALPQPRLIKTHMGYEMTPFSAQSRYLFIARNPFDCAVSFYHHTRGFPRHYDFADGTFADFFDCFLDGEVDFGDYFDHFVSWHAQTNRDNVLFLTYESLKRDPGRVIRGVASFLGAYAAASVASDEQLTRLVTETSLSSMQRNQQRWSSARPEWAPAFVRSGHIGDWQTLFAPSQTRALLAKFDRRLSDAGIENPWPDEVAAARTYSQMNVSNNE